METRHQNFMNSEDQLKSEGGGDETSLTFLDPIGLRSPVVVELHTLQDQWVSSPSTVRVFTTIITTSLLIGHLFSFMVFRIALRNGLSKPLNLLIFVDQAFKMIGSSITIPVIAASATLIWSEDKIPLATYTGRTFCHASYFVAGFTAVLNILLGEGVADKFDRYLAPKFRV